MQSRQRKPPIEIEELIKEENGQEKGQGGKSLKKLVRPKAEKRALSYNQEGGRRRGGSSRFRGSEGLLSNRNVILVALSVILTIALSLFIFSRRSDAEVLLSNQQILQTTQTSQGVQIDEANGRIDNIVENYATTQALSSAIAGIGLSSYATINQLNNAIANIPRDKLSCYGYLTGSSGNYTLNVEASPGTYMAKISLVYTTPYSLNVTAMDGAYGAFGGNWTGKKFVPEFSINGTTLEVVSSSFYTGSFTVAVNSWSGLLGSFVAPSGYSILVDVMPILVPA